VNQAVEKQNRQQMGDQRDRSKIQGYGKNERRVSRTRIKPIRCKIDFFIFESDQRAAPDLKVAPQSLSPVKYYSRTKPGYRRATELRPGVEKIS
jgi:hypothetical protein